MCVLSRPFANKTLYWRFHISMVKNYKGFSEQYEIKFTNDDRFLLMVILKTKNNFLNTKNNISKIKMENIDVLFSVGTYGLIVMSQAVVFYSTVIGVTSLVSTTITMETPLLKK